MKQMPTHYVLITDGGIDYNFNIAGLGVMRNHNGTWILGFAALITTVFHVELLTLLGELQLALDCDLTPP